MTADAMPESRLTDIQAKIKRAWAELGEVCAEGPAKRFRMSIPSNPERDTDLIVSAALECAAELLAEVERLNAAVQLLGAQLQRSSMDIVDELKAAAMAAEFERDVRLPASDVERFLKRERDEHDKTSIAWRDLDEVLEGFRLHMVTGTPLTAPKPTEGPEAPGVGPEPLTEAEELRAEVDRLKAELAASRGWLTTARFAVASWLRGKTDADTALKAIEQAVDG